MKKLAIIGASYLQQPLVRKAKEMGLHTICFAWDKDAVCKDVADEFFPISIVEKELILSICQEQQINGICTIASDTAAPTVAYVAQQMELVGNDYDAACRANNKVLMRNSLSEAKIPCPMYQSVSNINELSDSQLFISNQQSGGLIVKPSDRSGSLGVVKVNQAADLRPAVQSAIDLSFSHQAIIEQYIEGREISVEMISFQGNHYPLQITDKVTTGAPHFVELAHHQPSSLTEKQYEAIYALTKRALTALGITDGASHSEYRITSDGKLYVMEIGARMGGDFIGSNLVQLSTGYDFLKGVIDVALGHFTEPQLKSGKYAGIYFLCEQTAFLKPIIENHSLPEIVESEVTNQQLFPLTCSGDRSGYLIYQADRKIDLL